MTKPSRAAEGQAVALNDATQREEHILREIDKGDPPPPWVDLLPAGLRATTAGSCRSSSTSPTMPSPSGASLL